MNQPVIVKEIGSGSRSATYRAFAGVDTNNFTTKTDEEILAGARVVLQQHPPEKLRPFAKKILGKRFRITTDSMKVVGTILWGELCGWRKTYLLP